MLHSQGSILPQLCPQIPRRWIYRAPDCVLFTLWLCESSDTGPWIKTAKGLSMGVGVSWPSPHAYRGMAGVSRTDKPGLLVLALLHFTDCGFYKLNVCANPASGRSASATFPAALLTSCLCVAFWYLLQYFKPCTSEKITTC